MVAEGLNKILRGIFYHIFEGHFAVEKVMGEPYKTEDTVLFKTKRFDSHLERS